MHADLGERADAALYAAKHAGRRQTRRYAAGLALRPSASDERREIEALLRRPETIQPVFQPLLELATGRIGGYEALARIPGDRRPDQWFGQVERVVAEKVGREPVRYVGNILKYYVVYRRIAELEARKERAREAALARAS